MQHAIQKYRVRHPWLQKHIKFFWEIHIENAHLDHKIIPQRNISLRFNLNDTPQFVNINGTDRLMDNVFFSGLQDQFLNAHLKICGKVDTLGICFYPDGLFPFLKIPASEFKNQVFGSSEIGFRILNDICDKIKEAPDADSRLTILENELVKLLNFRDTTPNNFHKIFEALQQNEDPQRINDFCRRNNICIRQLERLYNKNVGVSATTFSTINRFHNSLNNLLRNDYSKMSDIAYDNGYFDQMHFIRDFKRFTGKTPKDFVRENNSILHVGKMN